jgi:hypothetical protein
LVYQSYLEPFFRQNEHELDQGILSTQSTVITFVQAKFQAVWDTVLGLVNGANARPGAGQRPGVPSPHQSYQGQPGAAPGAYDTARNLFDTYAPGVLGSLVNRAYGSAPADPNPAPKSPTRPSPIPNSSSSSTSLGNGSSPPYQRTPVHTPRNEGDTPGFPQPRFH